MHLFSKARPQHWTDSLTEQVGFRRSVARLLSVLMVLAVGSGLGTMGADASVLAQDANAGGSNGGAATQTVTVVVVDEEGIVVPDAAVTLARADQRIQDGFASGATDDLGQVQFDVPAEQMMVSPDVLAQEGIASASFQLMAEPGDQQGNAGGESPDPGAAPSASTVQTDEEEVGVVIGQRAFNLAQIDMARAEQLITDPTELQTLIDHVAALANEPITVTMTALTMDDVFEDWEEPGDGSSSAFGSQDVDTQPDGVSPSAGEIAMTSIPPCTFRTGQYIVGNRIWEDHDADGLWDSTHRNAGGIVVSLTKMGETIGQKCVTGSDGFYSFDVEPSTWYRLHVEITEDYRGFTLLNVGSDDAIDSDVDAWGNAWIYSGNGSYPLYSWWDAGLLPHANRPHSCLEVDRTAAEPIELPFHLDPVNLLKEPVVSAKYSFQQTTTARVELTGVTAILEAGFGWSTGTAEKVWWTQDGYNRDFRNGAWQPILAVKAKKEVVTYRCVRLFRPFVYFKKDHITLDDSPNFETRVEEITSDRWGESEANTIWVESLPENERRSFGDPRAWTRTKGYTAFAKPKVGTPWPLAPGASVQWRVTSEEAQTFDFAVLQEAWDTYDTVYRFGGEAPFLYTSGKRKALPVPPTGCRDTLTVHTPPGQWPRMEGPAEYELTTDFTVRYPNGEEVTPGISMHSEHWANNEHGDQSGNPDWGLLTEQWVLEGTGLEVYTDYFEERHSDPAELVPFPVSHRPSGIIGYYTPRYIFEDGDEPGLIVNVENLHATSWDLDGLTNRRTVEMVYGTQLIESQAELYVDLTTAPCRWGVVSPAGVPSVVLDRTGMLP